MQDSSEQSGMEEHQIIVDVDYNLLLIHDPLETRLLGVADEGERRSLRTEPDRVVIHTPPMGARRGDRPGARYGAFSC